MPPGQLPTVAAVGSVRPRRFLHPERSYSARSTPAPHQDPPTTPPRAQPPMTSGSDWRRSSTTSSSVEREAALGTYLEGLLPRGARPACEQRRRRAKPTRSTTGSVIATFTSRSPEGRAIGRRKRERRPAPPQTPPGACCRSRSLVVGSVVTDRASED